MNILVTTPAPQPEAKIKPGYMLLLIGSIPALAVLYSIVGVWLNDSPLSLKDNFVFTTLVALVVTGAYQLFFWVQRNNYFYPTRCYATSVDLLIPFWPSWVWVYSFLYYMAIGFVVATIQSITEGAYVIFGGALLLLVQCCLFFFVPTTVPPSFREYTVNSLSTRFLRFVQETDNGRNCMPSMHCSVAMYVSLTLMPVIGWPAMVFTALIAVSCLLVKQHQIADIPPGIALGAAVWWITQKLMG